MTARTKKIGFLAAKGIGIALFIWILTQTNTEKMMTILAGANKGLLLLAVGILMANISVKAMRWNIITRAYGGKDTPWESFCIYHVGYCLSVITPGRLGEFSKMIPLKKQGVGTYTAAGVVILDRVTDLLWVGSLGVIAMGLLFPGQWFSIIGILCVVGTILAACTYKKWIEVLRKSRQNKLFYPWNRVLCIKTLAISGASWAVYCCWALVIVSALHISIPAYVTISVFVLTGFVAILPIAPSGLGTREATMIVLLQPYGISSEVAVSLSLTMLSIFVVSAVIGAGCLLFDRSLYPFNKPDSVS